MHEGDALTEGSVENGFAVRAIHFDADRFETYLVEDNFRHVISMRLKEDKTRCRRAFDTLAVRKGDRLWVPLSSNKAQRQGLILNPLRYSATAASRSAPA